MKHVNLTFLHSRSPAYVIQYRQQSKKCYTACKHHTLPSSVSKRCGRAVHLRVCNPFNTYVYGVMPPHKAYAELSHNMRDYRLTPRSSSELCSSALLRFISLPTFRDNLSVPSSRLKNPKTLLTLQDASDLLSRNVGKEPQAYAA
jgi:hypothetical protein